MRRVLIRTVVALALVLSGWLVGRAQTLAEPDFTLSLDAPGGETRVTCTKGCVLQGGRDYRNEHAGYMLTYWYKCGGTNRCAATVNGWLKTVSVLRPERVARRIFRHRSQTGYLFMVPMRIRATVLASANNPAT